MANPIARLVAMARQNPALTVAVGGVGIAAAVSAWRRDPEPPPVTDAVAGGAVAPIAGYGAGLTSPFPGGTGDLYAAERSQQTATIVNAINALQLQRQPPAATMPRRQGLLSQLAAWESTQPQLRQLNAPTAATATTNDLAGLVVRLRRVAGVDPNEPSRADWRAQNVAGEDPDARQARLLAEFNYLRGATRPSLVSAMGTAPLPQPTT